jgi:predicted glycosyltransferase
MMVETRRVFFWVQHLLGIGHLRRAAVLARAMAADGLDVLLVSGGLPVRDLDVGAARFAQLQPVKAADPQFSALADAEGGPLDDEFKAARRDRLIEQFSDERPAAVITEMFPFGRRQLRFELLPLLEAVWHTPRRPRVFCSVRDVLTEKRKPGRYQEMAETTLRWFDHVLIHGDETLIPFGASFPETARIADRLCYTGYVAANPPAPSSENGGGREVLVSAGGGAVGAQLLQVALAARAHSRLAEHPWRLLAGDNLPSDTFDTLRAAAPPGVIVERARPDFPALLRGAAVSISQAGYNTVTDLLSAGTPAVLVPFADADETEQTLRARYLAKRGIAQLVEASDLNLECLAAAIDAAALAGRSAEHGVQLDGAAQTARIVRESLAV